MQSLKAVHHILASSVGTKRVQLGVDLHRPRPTQSFHISTSTRTPEGSASAAMVKPHSKNSLIVLTTS